MKPQPILFRQNSNGSELSSVILAALPMAAIMILAIVGVACELFRFCFG